jgi:Pyruvate/2-oxoacid:ferredoxin oxidoreductase gamma subunit
MSSSETNNTLSVDVKLVLAGVGGQGVLFATRLLSETAQVLELEFISSEVHGMSQRGGSVVSYLKIGPYESPLVRRGSADVLLAFALDEGYRNLGLLRPGGDCVVNCPNPASLDGEIQAYLEERDVTFRTLDADGLALAQLCHRPRGAVPACRIAEGHPGNHQPGPVPRAQPGGVPARDGGRL